MIRFTISLDKRQLAEIKKIGAKARTATAKALTFTAQDARDKLKKEVPAHFVLRRDWVVKGIRARPASGSTLMAQVGSVDKYMERHVVGAGRQKDPGHGLSIRSHRDRRGRYASGGLLIEPYGSIGSAQIHTVVRRKMRRAEGNKRKPFQVLAKSGKVLIVRRTSAKRYPLQTLAVLKGHVNVPHTWDFEGSVATTVKARFEGHFLRAVARAGV